MRARWQGSAAATRSAVGAEINVTPLVDVCLVLLIIFMVVTPLIKEGNGVSLPETRRPAALGENGNQLTIYVRADGTILWDSAGIGKGELVARLRAIRSTSPPRALVLKGDRRLKYGAIREVMRAISEAGYEQASLATHKKESVRPLG